MFVPVNWMRVTQIGIKMHDSFMQPSVVYMLAALAVKHYSLCRSHMHKRSKGWNFNGIKKNRGDVGWDSA